MSKSLPGRQVGKGYLRHSKDKGNKKKRYIPGHSYSKEMRYGEKDGLGTGVGMPLGFWRWGRTCPDLYFRKTNIGHKKNLEYGEALTYQAPLQQHI